MSATQGIGTCVFFLACFLLTIGLANAFQFSHPAHNNIKASNNNNKIKVSDTVGPTQWSMANNPLDPYGLIDVASDGSHFVFSSPNYGVATSLRNFYITNSDGKASKASDWGTLGYPPYGDFYLGTSQIVYAEHLELFVTYVCTTSAVSFNVTTTIGTSPDGITWTTVQVINGMYSTLSYLDNSTLVLSGQAYALEGVPQYFYTSTDGKSWAKQTLPTFDVSAELNPVWDYAYERFWFCGFFVLSFQNSSIWSTQDFKTWTAYPFTYEQGIPVDLVVTSEGSLITMLSPDTSFVLFHQFDENSNRWEYVSSIEDPDELLGIPTISPLWPRMTTNRVQGTSIVLGTYLTNDNFNTFTKIDPTAAGLAYRENLYINSASWMRSAGDLYFFFMTPNITTYSEDGKEWIPITSGVPHINTYTHENAPGPLYYSNGNWVFITLNEIPTISNTKINGVSYAFNLMATKDGENFTSIGEYEALIFQGLFFSFPGTESEFLAFGPTSGGGFWFGKDETNLQNISIAPLITNASLEYRVANVVLGSENALVTFLDYISFSSLIYPTYLAPINSLEDSSTWTNINEPNVIAASICGNSYAIFQGNASAEYVIRISSDGLHYSAPLYTPSQFFCVRDASFFGFSCANGALFAACAQTVYLVLNDSIEQVFKTTATSHTPLNSVVQSVNYQGDNYYLLTIVMGEVEKNESEVYTRTYSETWYSTTGLSGSWTNGTAPSFPARWPIFVDSIVSNDDGSQLLASGHLTTNYIATNQVFFIAS